MKGSEFVFDYVHLLYYKCNKINLNHAVSYIDWTNIDRSSDWKKDFNTMKNISKKIFSIRCISRIKS